MTLLLIAMPGSMAEVEYELHTGFDTTFTIREVDGRLVCGNDRAAFLLPIVVTVTDESGKPIQEAVAAIKRIEPGGYTEEDVRNTKDSSTDQLGRVTLYCPCGIDNTDPLKPKLRVLGAITVVAKGFKTNSLEFEKYFAGIELAADERAALAARLVLVRNAGK